MDDICITCFCKGQSLTYIGESKLKEIYLQMLNEPVAKMLESYLRICWECQANLIHFQRFKNQTQKCYAKLLNHIHQGFNNSTVKRPHIKVRNMNNRCINVKATEDDIHHEPETFVEEIQLGKIMQVSRKKVKLKKAPKQKLKKETIKRKILMPSSDVSDGDQEDPFVKSEPTSDTDDKVGGNIFKTLVELGADTTYEHLKEVEEKKTENEEIEKKETEKEEIEKKETEKEEIEKKEDIKTNKVTRTRSKEPLPDKPQCKECGKWFSSQKTYKYHLKYVLHKGQNQYPCPRCGKVYQWQSNLARHLRSHNAVDRGELYCDICDKKFASVATFRQHMRGSRRHVSETDFSFICNECGKKFMNKTRLRDHIDWEHLNKIKFKCQLCNKAFKCSTSLYAHQHHIHREAGKKANLCHVCGKSYQNAAKLRYHFVAMHTSETPYRCERCSAAFGSYSSFYRHVREVHYKVKLIQKKPKKTKKIPDDLQTPHSSHQLSTVE